MRILMLNNEFPPLGGGTGMVNLHVLREMEQLGGVEVDLVTSSRTRSTCEREEFGRGIWIHKVPVDNRNIHHSTNRELATFLLRGYRYSRMLMSQQPFHLSLAWAGVPAGAISYLLSRRSGLPYVVSLQGPDVPWYEHRYYWMYPLLTPVIRRIWRSASAVTACSDAHKELALRTAPALGIKVIPNGVDTEAFKPAGRGERGAGGAPIRILCSARLIARKGQQHLLRAIHLLDREGVRNVEVLLVGTGDAEKTLKRSAAMLGVADRFRFLGMKSRADMCGIVAAADLFVLPSYNEGMSLALLEAMAGGLPVVVTDTGGTRELLDGNGYVVPWADPAALAVKLKELIDSPERRSAMGRRSREIAMNFTWRKVTERYLECCERVVAGCAS